jgi:hypothetical protein
VSVPNASEVPQGAVVVWTSATERTRFRLGLALLVVASVGIGTAAGYAIGRRRPKRSNPRRRRR